jgi:hypothetical protein
MRELLLFVFLFCLSPPGLPPGKGSQALGLSLMLIIFRSSPPLKR